MPPLEFIIIFLFWKRLNFKGSLVGLSPSPKNVRFNWTPSLTLICQGFAKLTMTRIMVNTFRRYSKQSFFSKEIMEKHHQQELEHLKVSPNSLVQQTNHVGINRLLERIGRGSRQFVVPDLITNVMNLERIYIFTRRVLSPPAIGSVSNSVFIHSRR